MSLLDINDPIFPPVYGGHIRSMSDLGQWPIAREVSERIDLQLLMMELRRDDA